MICSPTQHKSRIKKKSSTFSSSGNYIANTTEPNWLFYWAKGGTCWFWSYADLTRSTNLLTLCLRRKQHLNETQNYRKAYCAYWTLFGKRLSILSCHFICDCRVHVSGDKLLQRNPGHAVYTLYWAVIPSSASLIAILSSNQILLRTPVQNFRCPIV